MNCTLQQSWRHSNQSVSDDPGAVQFGVALFAVALLGLWPLAAMAVLGISLLASVLLSSEFFAFVRLHRWSIGWVRRQGPRGMLLVRTSCWGVGAAISGMRHLRFVVGRQWNILCSILHFWRPGRISKLFYFVTSRCNARCSFCFNLDNVVNWKQRRPDELSLEELKLVARRLGRLPYLTLSGGEPFIREDLPDVIQAFHEHARTQWVTIPSNAALTDRTVRATLEILNKRPGLFLTIQVSIDGLFEVHDRSRVLPGGFEKMSKTLKRLAEVRRRYPNLRLQIATCYDDFNREQIEEIVDHCRESFDYDQQMFYLIRDQHALITDVEPTLLTSYFRLLSQHEEYEWKEQRRTLWNRAVRALQGLVYRDLAEIKAKGTFLRPCTATQKFATLWDDGQITPCEILEDTRLGNIKDFDYDFYALKREQHVDDLHRRDIVATKCNCDWMCAIPINMLYDPSVFGRVILALIRPGSIVTKTPVEPVQRTWSAVSVPVLATESVEADKPPTVALDVD